MNKLYVSEDSDISEDCLYADETKLVSYFEESECELEYEDCKLFLLKDYVKDKDQQIEELKKQLEEKDKAIEMLKSIDRYDIGEMLTENTKLKAQLHSQPKEIVEKIKDLAGDYFYITGENDVALTGNDFTEILENVLK